MRKPYQAGPDCRDQEAEIPASCLQMRAPVCDEGANRQGAVQVAQKTKKGTAAKTKSKTKGGTLRAGDGAVEHTGDEGQPGVAQEDRALARLTGESQINGEDPEIRFTREILCQLIVGAWKDATNERSYQRKNTKNHRDKNRSEARYFLRSRAFEAMCLALGLPGDKIRMSVRGLYREEPNPTRFGPAGNAGRNTDVGCRKTTSLPSTTENATCATRTTL